MAFGFPTPFREYLGLDVHHAHLEIPVNLDRFNFEVGWQKRGFVACLCQRIPMRVDRFQIDRLVTKSSRERSIIYCDQAQGTQVWQWVRRDARRSLANRDHRIDVGGTGDVLSQRLETVPIALDEKDFLTMVDVARRARATFDVEKMTKKFHKRCRTEHNAFHKLIDGGKDPTLITDLKSSMTVKRRGYECCFIVAREFAL